MHSRTIAAVALLITAGAGQGLTAQTRNDVKLHVNPRWKECSLQLDPSLTQAAWHQFAQEAGLVTYFRAMSDAAPMGKGQFELSAMQWKTGIHDSDAAWNDTFVHPDSTHWLTEGAGLQFPGLMVRAGITDRVDGGVYFTKNPSANYGFYGGQLQYAVAEDASRRWALSTRASFVSLFGPEDLAFSVYGVDVVASRRIPLFANRASISPYVAGSTYLAHAHEKSAVVSLSDENVLGVQGTVGAAAQLSIVRVSAEYGVAKVQSMSLKIGVSRKL